MVDPPEINEVAKPRRRPGWATPPTLHLAIIVWLPRD